MANAKQFKIVFAVLTLITLLVVLGISIATLVKVYQKPKQVQTESKFKINHPLPVPSILDENGLPNKPNLMNVLPPVTINPSVGL